MAQRAVHCQPDGELTADQLVQRAARHHKFRPCTLGRDVVNVAKSITDRHVAPLASTAINTITMLFGHVARWRCVDQPDARAVVLQAVLAPQSRTLSWSRLHALYTALPFGTVDRLWVDVVHGDLAVHMALRRPVQPDDVTPLLARYSEQQRVIAIHMESMFADDNENAGVDDDAPPLPDDRVLAETADPSILAVFDSSVQPLVRWTMTLLRDAMRAPPLAWFRQAASRSFILQATSAGAPGSDAGCLDYDRLLVAAVAAPHHLLGMWLDVDATSGHLRLSVQMAKRPPPGVAVASHFYVVHRKDEGAAPGDERPHHEAEWPEETLRRQ